MKAQASTEFIMILAVMLLITAVIVGFVMDIPGTFHTFAAKKNVEQWQTAPVGVVSIIHADDDIYVTLVNNQRYRVLVERVSLNDVIVSDGSASIDSGQTHTYVYPYWGVDFVVPSIQFVKSDDPALNVTVEKPFGLRVLR